MDDQSYFMVEGYEWQQQRYYESEDYPKTTVRVLLWLVVSECGVSESVFFKSILAVNKKQYISKCLPALYKFIKNTKKKEITVYWHDLASAKYAKDMLA
jgi:hypothetical protein